MALAPELVGLMGAMLAVLLLTMLAFAYRATFGAMLQSLALLFRAINIHVPWVGSLGLGSVADAIDRVDHQILHGIGVAIGASEYALSKVWSYTAYTLSELGDALGYLAEQTEAALHTLRHAVIPRLIAEAQHLATAPLAATLAAFRAATRAAEAELVRELHRARRAATAALALALVRLHRLEVEAVAIPGRIGREVGDLRGWTTRQLRRVLRRVAALEGLLTAAGLTALVALVLTRLGVGWVRCSKVGRVGKAVCGLDESLLQSVLADSLAIFGTLSLLEFARELEEGVKDISRLGSHFWRADVPGHGADRQLGHTA